MKFNFYAIAHPERNQLPFFTVHRIENLIAIKRERESKRSMWWVRTGTSINHLSNSHDFDCNHKPISIPRPSTCFFFNFHSFQSIYILAIIPVACFGSDSILSLQAFLITAPC